MFRSAGVRLVKSFGGLTTRFNSTKAYDLSNYRTLLRVRGLDSANFLQNMITNDMRLLTSPDSTLSAIYAMILNNRGRLMYDVIVYKDKDASFLIELDAKSVNDAMKLFKMLKIKKKVEITSADSEYKLVALTGPIQNNQVDMSCLYTKDPRFGGLGSRLIVNKTQSVSNVVNNIEIGSDLNEYRKHLYRNGVAENTEDFKQGSSIPLEYNLVFLNGVSFDKGCYLGQELVAKTHHTGVIRKRIMPIQILDKSDDSEFGKDNTILNTKTGQTAGKLTNLIDQDGIALLRLANLDKTGLVLLDNNKKQVPIRARVPEYWPVGDEALTELKSFTQD